MKNVVALSVGLLLAASPDCWSADVFLINGGDFNTAANWSDGMLPTADGDVHFVQDGLTATFSSGTTSVARLIVSDTSPGTLNITGGDLTANIAGDDFQIARSRNVDPLSPGGFVDLSGTAILRTGTNSTVGDRDKGVLHVGPNASVLSPGAFWRVGNHGHSIDVNPENPTGLEGEGLLDVEGTFSSHAMFIGVNDGVGTLRVRGNGSVTLTDVIEDFNHHPIFHPNQSATIHMVGSNASLSALDLIWDHDAASPIKNLAWFEADSGGVSPIILSDEVNINNNALRVNLTGYTVAPGQKILLFDAAPTRITGAFASLEILGANPANYIVVYDQPTGDILLMNTVPEPSTVILLGFGALLATAAMRRPASQ
jgi:PEP-CTERM motif